MSNRADYMQVMSLTFLNKSKNERANYEPNDKRLHQFLGGSGIRIDELQ